MNFFFFSLGLLSFIGDGNVVGKVMNRWNNGVSRRISYCLRLKLPSKPRNVAEYWYSRKLLLFFTSISCSLCFCLILLSFFDFSTRHFFLAFHPVHLISLSPRLYMDKCILYSAENESCRAYEAWSSSTCMTMILCDVEVTTVTLRITAGGTTP